MSKLVKEMRDKEKMTFDEIATATGMCDRYAASKYYYMNPASPKTSEQLSIIKCLVDQTMKLIRKILGGVTLPTHKEEVSV